MRLPGGCAVSWTPFFSRRFSTARSSGASISAIGRFPRVGTDDLDELVSLPLRSTCRERHSPCGANPDPTQAHDWDTG